MMPETELEELRRKYANKLVFVVINNPYHPIADRGLVTFIDDFGRLYGTWGDQAAVPGIDHIELL